MEGIESWFFFGGDGDLGVIGFGPPLHSQKHSGWDMTGKTQIYISGICVNGSKKAWQVGDFIVIHNFKQTFRRERRLELPNNILAKNLKIVCKQNSWRRKKERSPTPALSVLQRLDRLDHLLQVLEERQSLSAKYPSGLVAEKITAKEQDHCKTISSALEEAHHKGTLMDRVAMLEDRILQLSLEIEVGNISKSSYSVVPTTTENVNQHTSELAVVAMKSADLKEHRRENPHPLSTQEKGCADAEACPEKTKTAGSHKGKRRSMLRRSKWLCAVV